MMDHAVVEKLLQIEIVADEMLDEMPRTACLGIRSILQPIPPEPQRLPCRKGRALG